MDPESTHVPRPLQESGSVCVPTEHEERSPHAEPSEAFPHVPKPLQAPVEHWLAAHSLSGSELSRMLPQVPSAPPPFFAALQAVHDAEQAESQQKPSAQKPVAHSFVAEHTAPCAFFAVQEPATQ